MLLAIGWQLALADAIDHRIHDVETAALDHLRKIADNLPVQELTVHVFRILAATLRHRRHERRRLYGVRFCADRIVASLDQCRLNVCPHFLRWRCWRRLGFLCRFARFLAQSLRFLFRVGIEAFALFRAACVRRAPNLREQARRGRILRAVLDQRRRVDLHHATGRERFRVLAFDAQCFHCFGEFVGTVGRLELFGPDILVLVRLAQALGNGIFYGVRCPLVRCAITDRVHQPRQTVGVNRCPS